MAITASYNRIDKYIVTAQLRQPLHVGSVDKGTGEVLVHPVKERPFVQASSIAGVFRACYEGLYGKDEQSRYLFGDNEELAGRIRFTDGVLDNKVQIELRPRISIDSATGTSATSKGKGIDSASGQKFETEYIGTGAKIKFSVYIYSDQNLIKRDESGQYLTEKEKIERVFALIHSGEVQFGGQKSNGCGSMEILSLKHHVFYMLTEKGRKEWSLENREDSLSYDNLLDELNKMIKENQQSIRAYTILLDAKPEGSILVKSIALTDEEIKRYVDRKETAPDYVNIRNAEGYYIVPGSSVKGAVRSQVERIAGYLDKNVKNLNKKQVIDDSFGRVGKKKDTGSIGNVRFYDVLIKPVKGCKHDVVSNRIHIDRFTGGVMHTGLFKEQSVHGSMCIEAAVMKDVQSENTLKADRSCALLVLGLRDLALGTYNLGSGYSVGRGFLCAQSLKVIRFDGKEAVISFSRSDGDDRRINMSVKDTEDILVDCMKALTKQSEEDAKKDSRKEEA